MYFKNLFSFPKKNIFFAVFMFMFSILFFYFPCVFLFVDQNAIIGESLKKTNNLFENDYDVLLLGDSRCHQGCDPSEIKKNIKEIMGKDYKVINLGRPAMQTPFFYFVLSRYLETCVVKPKVVIVNASFYLLGGHKGYREDIYLTHYRPEIKEVYHAIHRGLVTPFEGIKWYIVPRIPLLKYRKKIRTTLESFSKGDFMSPFVDYQLYNAHFNESHNGYYSRGGETFDPFNAAPYDYKQGIYEEKVFLNYLEYFFNLASKHGVKVILYSFPWPKQLETEEMYEILSYYRKLLVKTSENYNNVRVLETEYFWNPNCFSDQQHLNQRGADLLAKEIAVWIKEYL